jgi:hypothetical protein
MLVESFRAHGESLNPRSSRRKSLPCVGLCQFAKAGRGIAGRGIAVTSPSPWPSPDSCTSRYERIGIVGCYSGGPQGPERKRPTWRRIRRKGCSLAICATRGGCSLAATERGDEEGVEGIDRPPSAESRGDHDEPLQGRLRRRLKNRSGPNQATEVAIRYKLLNGFVALGMPLSIWG